MALSRQVHLPWLVLTVAQMFGSVPAQFVPGPATVYEFCYPTDTLTVRVNTTSPPFIIQSTNFGRGDYPNGVKCSLNIVSSLQPVVLSYYFRQCDVQYQQFCIYDSVTVDGINLCGTWLVGRTLPIYREACSASTLLFATDGSVTKPGFEIIVTPEVAREKYQGSTEADNTHC